MIAYYLIFLAIAGCFLFSKAKIDKEKSAIFSSKDSIALKGFFAMIIIFHHVGQSYFHSNKFINYLGGIGVGVFFMLSAYGLFKSTEKNNFNYAKRLFLVKIPKLYLFQCIVNVIYCGIFNHFSSSLKEILIHIFNFDVFFGYSLTNWNSWFITTILIIYVLFAICLLFSKLIKKTQHKKYFIISVCSFIITLVYILTMNGIFKFPVLYVRCLLCFPLGLFVACFESAIIKLKEHKITHLISTVFFFGMIILSYFFIPDEHIITIFVCCLLVLLSIILDFSYSKTMIFIGKISLEIYLFHGIFTAKIPITDNICYYMLAVIGSAIIVSFIVHTIKEFIVNLVKSSLIKKKKEDI